MSSRVGNDRSLSVDAAPTLNGGGRAKRLAWRQLLRVGNVFTAVSNILAGYLLVHRGWASLGEVLLLCCASAMLYLAGMALNDAFDATIDAQERPERPIPSGRIRRNHAFTVGWSLLTGGVAVALATTLATGAVAPAIVGSCLAVTIVLYDGGLKRGWAGPWAMGWCRSLNVLLGASTAADLQREPTAWKYAAAVGLYTVGISYLARDEAETSPAPSSRTAPILSAATLTGTVVAMLLVVKKFAFAVPRYAWGNWFLTTFAAVALAWAHRWFGEPRRRVAAIVGLLRGFIVLDALAATAAAGWTAGAIVLALLAPTVIASRRAPMT